MTRARFAVATALTTAAITVGVVTLPAALPGLAATASPAARDQGNGSPVSVAVTGMSPQWAGPKSIITVSGTVTNTSTESLTDLSVQLEAASGPLSSATVLQQYVAHPYPLGGNAVTGRQPISSGLKPGQSAHWAMTFRAKAAGLTKFGVYPLTAQVSADVGGASAAPLSSAYTFLPYVPAKHTKFAKSVPASKPIAWVWPMIDYPLISVPGPRLCSGSQVTALRASLAAGGRLDRLLAAGSQYAAAEHLTWAVDPALLGDVRSLAHCQHAPGTAKVAAAWLARFRAATKAQSMFVTPYADVELSLIQHHTTDVARAFKAGQGVADQILEHGANGPQISGTAWPPSGTADGDTLSAIAAKANVQTLLLSDGQRHAGPGNVFQTANGVGGTATVLLYSNWLNLLLGAATARPGSGFATTQDFLAETALLAQARNPKAIIVAPPRRWAPPDGVAATLLAHTANVPWLQPAPLSSLEQHVTSKLTLPASTPTSERFSRRVVRKFGVIDALINQIGAIQANDQHFSLAVMALQSSAWHGMTRRAQLAQIRPLIKFLQQQQKGVTIAVATRVVLGGLKGTLPVLIDNRLHYPVKVRIGLRWKQPPGGGLKVSKLTKLITVPANGQEPVRIRIEAAQVGSTTLTVRLLSPDGRPLAVKVANVTVQATEFGNVAMIVLASVLGVFVIGSAIRGARRRDLPPPGDSGDPEPPDPDAAHGSQNEAETDTVFSEHSELGTAGTSGL